MIMATKDKQQSIEKLQREAYAAYQQFLLRLDKLEKQRSDIVQETLGGLDKKKIDSIRSKLGLTT